MKMSKKIFSERQVPSIELYQLDAKSLIVQLGTRCAQQCTHQWRRGWNGGCWQRRHHWAVSARGINCPFNPQHQLLSHHLRSWSRSLSQSWIRSRRAINHSRSRIHSWLLEGSRSLWWQHQMVCPCSSCGPCGDGDRREHRLVRLFRV